MPFASDRVHEVKATLFRVLGHPARVRILELLRDGERSVGALQAELGLDSGGTSQHLAALRRIGLVESRREGTSVYYRVDDEAVLSCLLPAGRSSRGSSPSSSRCWTSSVIHECPFCWSDCLRSHSVRWSRWSVGTAGRACAAGRWGGGRLSGRVSCARDGSTIGAGFTSAFAPQFGVDGLSGLFLGALGLVAAAALVFSRGYLEPDGRGRAVAALTGVLVLVLAGVFCARDPLTFLAGWELMTLVPALVILVARNADRASRRVVFVYLAVTHLGGVGTWIAILLLAHAGAVGGAAAISSGSGMQTAIALAAIVGMGTKAGVMPLHVWLPRAHPIAPAPVSALMSGVMIKAGIYALVRVLVDWLGVLPIWIGVLVLGLGALSAVGGVVYALFQHDLKRLLAFHSVENIGIIVLGIGACLLLHSRGANLWASFALAAALLHTLNHAVFKALLFLGAGAFEKAVGSLELDRLGGLLRRMPWTGGAFLVGAMAIAGLPPLNGFASEWLTLQALLHVPAYGGVAAGTAGAIALAALAATAALAVFCFVKVGGLALLGPPRTKSDRAASEAAWSVGARLSFSRRGVSCSGSCRGCSSGAGWARALGLGCADAPRGCSYRVRGRCPRSRSCSCSLR